MNRHRYRTIKGHEYQAWLCFPSEDRIAAYREAGIRCRRFGDELYVHVADTEEVAAIDGRMARPPR